MSVRAVVKRKAFEMRAIARFLWLSAALCALGVKCQTQGRGYKFNNTTDGVNNSFSWVQQGSGVSKRSDGAYVFQGVGAFRGVTKARISRASSLRNAREALAMTIVQFVLLAASRATAPLPPRKLLSPWALEYASKTSTVIDSYYDNDRNIRFTLMETSAVPAIKALVSSGRLSSGLKAYLESNLRSLLEAAMRDRELLWGEKVSESFR